MRGKPTFREKINYLFDNYMSRGTLALILGLGVLSFLLICVAAVVVTVGGNLVRPEGVDRITFLEAFWASLMRTLDPGTMGGDIGWGFRLVMLFVTLGGIFIVSALIGVLNTGLEAQLDRLRKGRSRVLESGHILILGWSPQIFMIISELMIANENQRGARIVVLAGRDKLEMEEEIRERVERRGSTRVICRTGNPIDLTDLEIGSPHTARSIIVLPPETDEPDSYVIKTVLAITNNPNRREEPYSIVTQIHDPKNLEVVRAVAADDRILPLLTGDLIARVIAQTSRQSGLSVVYTELMNFSGDEIYFKAEPGLSGKTFAEAIQAYEDSALLGLRKGDGRLYLNPDMEMRLEPGDQLFALSEDDDTIHLSGISPVSVEEGLIRDTGDTRSPAPEKTLIIGWNRSAGTIVRELDAYVARGSQITVVSESDRAEQAVRAFMQRQVLTNQKVVFVKGETTSRELLDGLHVVDFDHVIVLASSDLGFQEADARTLVTLLHLRDIAERDETPFSIVSEMLDLRNRELAEVARVDDFIVSEHLVSLMLAQLAENPNLYDIFQDIFDPEGAEIYLKPIGEYIEIDQPVNFYTLLEAACRRGETAIGYRLSAEANSADRDYGVRVNPRKSEKVIYTPEDKVIVVAEK
jgi:voltage-gated potassium channel Kch